MTDATITERDVALAVERGRRRMATEFRASSAQYDAKRDTIELTMVDGWGLVFRRQQIPEFAELDAHHMDALQVSPAGTAILVEESDVHVSVHGLVTSFISPHLMAATLGQMGGKTSSPAKKRTAQANGKKGGRPKRKVA